MELVFDPEKDAKNLQKHGMRLRDAHNFEWPKAMIVPDLRKAYSERRFIAYGPVSGRLHVLVFTPREGFIRVISLRKANLREQKKYEKEQA